MQGCDRGFHCAGKAHLHQASCLANSWAGHRHRQDKAEQGQAADKLRHELQWLQDQMDSAGPWFMGREFSLVDCAILPWFLRMPVLEHYRGFHVPGHLTQVRRRDLQDKAG